MKGTAVTACLSLLYSYLAFGQKVTYEGNQLWKISNHHKNTLTLLKGLEKENYITLWGFNATTVDAMVNANSLDEVRKRLQEQKLDYQVSIDDIQKVIDEDNQKPPEDTPRKPYRLTWNYYHPLDDIYDFLHNLEETFPKLCTIRTIGRSIEGRPLKLLRLSNHQPNNKAVFIEGGIHAREWVSPASTTYIIHHLVTNFDKQPPYIRNIDWYFVPVLNPDGYEYSYNVERLWRKNRSRSKSSRCIGVDLNRNWGYDWGKNGSSKDPCSGTYRGRRPFSEPETAAVANFFNNNPGVKWAGYIALHSYGQFIVYPWGSTAAVLEDIADLNRVGVEAATNILLAGGDSYTVGPAGIAIYDAAGISIDWAKGAQAVKYAFAIELRDTGTYGYVLPAKYIKPTSEEALVALETIMRAVGS